MTGKYSSAGNTRTAPIGPKDRSCNCERDSRDKPVDRPGEDTDPESAELTILVLRIRTSGGMIELSDREAGELRERLRRVAAAQPAEETIAVSANASTSVTFTHTQKVAMIDVLAQWMNELGGEEFGEGLFKLRDALTNDLERE